MKKRLILKTFVLFLIFLSAGINLKMQSDSLSQAYSVKEVLHKIQLYAQKSLSGVSESQTELVKLSSQNGGDVDLLFDAAQDTGSSLKNIRESLEEIKTHGEGIAIYYEILARLKDIDKQLSGYREKLSGVGDMREPTLIKKYSEELLPALSKLHFLVTDMNYVLSDRMLEMTRAVNALSNQISATYLLIFLFAIALAAAMEFASIVYITEPISKLIKGAEIIGKGNLIHKIDLTTKDEMGVLAESFNEMTYKLKKVMDQLCESNEKLKELDKMKSEFLAIVSHDMRSPLASIMHAAELIL